MYNFRIEEFEKERDKYPKERKHRDKRRITKSLYEGRGQLCQKNGTSC